MLILEHWYWVTWNVKEELVISICKLAWFLGRPLMFWTNHGKRFFFFWHRICFLKSKSYLLIVKETKREKFPIGFNLQPVSSIYFSENHHVGYLGIFFVNYHTYDFHGTLWQLEKENVRILVLDYFCLFIWRTTIWQMQLFPSRQFQLCTDSQSLRKELDPLLKGS